MQDYLKSQKMNKRQIKINNLNLHLKGTASNNYNSLSAELSKSLVQHLEKDKTLDRLNINKFIRNIDINITGEKFKNLSHMEEKISSSLADELIKRI